MRTNHNFMIKRELFEKIKPWLQEEKILIIKGARQTGKTTFLLFLKKYLENKGEKVVYFSVDQELANPAFEQAKAFLRFVNEQYRLSNFKKERKLYILLDEFQYAKNAGLFLKNIFDQEKERMQLIVSGSSSLEISKSSEFLTGRKIDFFLGHFSFQEFLVARSNYKYNFSWNRKDSFKDLDDFYCIYRSDLEANLLDYLSWGGYPEVTTTVEAEKRLVLLRDIVSTYIQKDVAGFLRVANISGFNNLVILLCNQAGNLVNKNELSNTLGINIRSINHYLDILAGTYVFYFLNPYYANLRKSLTKRSKVYVEDLGIYRAILRKASYDNFDIIGGNVVENFVYNELAKKVHRSDIMFSRSAAGSEIDFIIRQDDSIIPIEVKFQKKVKKMPVAIEKLKSDQKEKIKISAVITRDNLRKDNQGNIFIPLVLLPFLNFKN